MHSLVQVSWLIPLFPVLGASLVAILLFSFNRTINRLTKPVTYFILICLALSTCLSLLLYFQHISDEVLDFHFSFSSIDLDLALAFNQTSSLAIGIIGLIVLFILFYLFKTLPRKEGYVRSFALTSFVTGLFFLLILSTNLPLNINTLGSFIR